MAPSARMQQLLEAAVVVVARSGLRGLTHRAVDAQAGLPEGSTSGYLRTRLALLSALTGFVAERLSSDVDDLATRLTQEACDLDAAIEATVALFVGWLEHPQIALAKSELALEAIRQPALMEAFAPWRIRLVGIVAGIIERSGRPNAAARAQAVVAALDGILTAALSQPADRQLPFVRDTVRLVVASIAEFDAA